MKIKQHIAFLLLLSLAIMPLNACAATAASPEVQYVVVTATVPPITNTPDPCGPESIEGEVQKVHTYMREFDDASSLAASRPQEELGNAIAELQRIRRETEDQPTPACLTDLRTFQVSHMNAVINTLVGFMGGSDQATVDQGIAQARDLHDNYTLELARLLGLTVEPASIVTPEQTPSP
jgi:hypothetical protein